MEDVGATENFADRDLNLTIEERLHLETSISDSTSTSDAKDNAKDTRIEDKVQMITQGSPAVPYLTFTVPPGRVAKFTCQIWSHDQGWSDDRMNHGTYNGSYTWFEMRYEGTARELAPFVIQRNVHASRIAKHHTITWDTDQKNITEASIFMSTLRASDQVGIYPMARFQGWMNYVYAMTVDLETKDDNGRTRRIRMHRGRLQEVNRVIELPESTSNRNKAVVMDAASTTPDRSIRPEFQNDVSIYLDMLTYLTKSMNAFEDAFKPPPGAAHIEPATSFVETVEKLEQALLVFGQLKTLASRIDDTPKDFPALADVKKVTSDLNKAVNQVSDLRFPGRERIAGLLAVIQLIRRHMSAKATALAATYQKKYDVTGAMPDLELDIEILRQAKSMMMPECLSETLLSLGGSLGERYRRIGARADLEEAIVVSEQAVETHSDYNPRFFALNNLGELLGQRYSRIGNEHDLQRSIEIIQEAILLIPEDHEVWVWSLNSLADRLGEGYDKTGDMHYLDAAIPVHRKAVNAVSKDHKRRQVLLNGLAVALSKRWRRTGTTADSDEAFQLFRESINATPDGHQSHRAGLLNNLGNQLSLRYQRDGTSDHLKEAIQCHQSNLTSSEASIITRIAAGVRLLELHACVSDWKNGLKDATIAIELASKLVARSLENSDKQHRLRQIAGLACNASAAAFELEEKPLVALNLLEQGRGVLAASLDEMRIDLLGLEKEHPELAKKFTQLRDELQPPNIQGRISSRESYTTLDLKTDRRYIAANELDKLIATIRQLHGFGDFLRHPSEEDMLEAGKHGPIVVVNASRYRCDAILIDEHQIRSIKLSKLTHRDIKEKTNHQDLRSAAVLKWLWDTVAFPVLEELGFMESPPADIWPHIWWVPTGPLSKFPIHAAGYHSHGSNHTVLDRAMSSYSSSVQAIVHGRRRGDSHHASKTSSQALLVGLRDTPNYGRLDYAPKEIEVVHKLLKSSELQSSQPNPCKEDVVSRLKTCKIFHFAGHGYTDDDDPSRSALVLEDHVVSPLTVADLLDLNFRDQGPFLAYLSACGTGEMRNERFFDESIHLISAYQIAGFKHVIGTLWDVHDESCVMMAKTFYEEMMLGGMTDSSVSLGLHKATRKLRDIWLGKAPEVNSEEEDLVEAIVNKKAKRGFRIQRLPVVSDSDEEEDEVAPLHWVPYVHFGV
ncbi:unnamed protein product [Periconia digitata]|uniref:CHAT domain-containing protein n=1 Tax=Periconia digitata TaxID=1303443 RepID=A0A9W4UKK1_9PLEO|nr:unnamed protein product [Periconia digitata]